MPAPNYDEAQADAAAKPGWREGAGHKTPMQHETRLERPLSRALLSFGNVYEAPAHAAKKHAGGPFGVFRARLRQTGPSALSSHRYSRLIKQINITTRDDFSTRGAGYRHRKPIHITNVNNNGVDVTSFNQTVVDIGGLANKDIPCPPGRINILLVISG